MKPAQQVQVVSVGVAGRLLLDPLFLLRRQGHRECSGDLLRDLALHFEDVGQLTVEGLAPQMLLGAGIHQVDDDPDPRPRLAHASLEDRSNAELFRDRGDLLGRLLVLHRGRPGDHLERADLGELGDDVVGDPVAEVLVLGIGAHVLERQHGDRLRGPGDLLSNGLGRTHRDRGGGCGSNRFGELGGRGETVGRQVGHRLPDRGIHRLGDQLAELRAPKGPGRSTGSR